MGLELHEPHELGTIPLGELPDDGTIAVITSFNEKSMIGQFVQRKNDRLSMLGERSSFDYPDFFGQKHDAALVRCRLLKPGELLRVIR